MKIEVIEPGYRNENGAICDATVAVDGNEYALVFALAMGMVTWEWAEANLGR